MTQAIDLITEAAEIAGIIGGGETLSGDDAESILRTLNYMLDGWNAERLSLFTVQESVYSTAAASFTIGTGGNVDIERTSKLEDAFIRVSGTDYHLVIMSREFYANLGEKALSTGLPTHLYYDAQAPLGTCHFWPKPTGAVEVHLGIAQPLSEFATVNTEVALPQGYRKAIAYNLAVELKSGKFSGPISPKVEKIATASKRNLKRLNRPDMTLQLPAVMTAASSSIYEG